MDVSIYKEPPHLPVRAAEGPLTSGVSFLKAGDTYEVSMSMLIPNSPPFLDITF